MLGDIIILRRQMVDSTFQFLVDKWQEMVRNGHATVSNFGNFILEGLETDLNLEVLRVDRSRLVQMFSPKFMIDTLARRLNDRYSTASHPSVVKPADSSSSNSGSSPDQVVPGKRFHTRGESQLPKILAMSVKKGADMVKRISFVRKPDDEMDDEIVQFWRLRIREDIERHTWERLRGLDLVTYAAYRSSHILPPVPQSIQPPHVVEMGSP
jgi:hypothetical protein